MRPIHLAFILAAAASVPAASADSPEELRQKRLEWWRQDTGSLDDRRLPDGGSLSRPGVFDVAIITSEQKYGKGWEGGHRLTLDVAGKQIRGTVSNDGHLENPSNPYWPYVISKLGQIEIAKGGTYKMSLQPESIEASKQFGLTLVSVTLVPHRL